MTKHVVTIHPLASEAWRRAPSLPAEAREVLSRWKDLGLPAIPLFPVQEGEAGEAALRRARGRYDSLPALTYRDLQSLATRYQGLMLRFPPRDVAGGSHYENAERGPGRGKRGNRHTAGMGGGQGSRQGGQGAGGEQEGAQRGGRGRDGEGEEGSGHEGGGRKRRRGSRGKSRRLRRQERAAGGAGPVWVPAQWPQPRPDQVHRARRLLEALREETVEAAREVMPNGWDKKALAVRGELAQPDRARRWERLGLPTLLLALDFSGSINVAGMTEPFAAAGAALGEALPWLVIMDASNGEVGHPLIPAWAGRGKEVAALRGGRPWTPRGWPHTTWERVVQEAQVAGLIYVGDWEDERILRPLLGKVHRLAAVSVWQSSWRRPTRTDYHYGRRTPWPTVVGCGSVEEILDALEIILAAWRERV